MRSLAWAAEPAWIFDSWGYPAVRDIMWQSADTVLWLDYPAAVVLPRVVRRSVVRTATNVELFGGNRETLRECLSPEHPVWSAAATFRARREYLFDRTARSPHIRTVRFIAQREFEHWYELLSASTGRRRERAASCGRVSRAPAPSARATWG